MMRLGLFSKVSSGSVIFTCSLSTITVVIAYVIAIVIVIIIYAKMGWVTSRATNLVINMTKFGYVYSTCLISC